MRKAKVLLIYTGGTIGMVEDPETGSLHPFDFGHLLNEIPELHKFDITIDSVSLEKPIDSSDMNPKIWLKLIAILEKEYKNFHGFVILHGTDTMAYSASALSFLLENVNKPIIFTGSQLPIGKIRTDGKENIITAIEIAADYVNGAPIVPEVAIYFEDALYRANRTAKVSAEDFEAFQSPNYPSLAEVGIHIKYNHFAIKKIVNKPLKAHKGIAEEVASIRLFPGIQPQVFKAICEIEGLKALVLETYGSGNATTETWLTEEIKKLNTRGVIILNITQCIRGKVIQSKYEAGAHLERLGVISGVDMTFEAAITKLMYLLAREDLDLEQKKELLQKDIRGEVTL